MQSLPFARPGQFYRGNIHCHSNLSDGEHDPQVVCDSYRQAGYDFIAITDHWLPRRFFRRHRHEPGVVTVVDTTPYRTDDFTTILGAELHGPAMANGERWHMVAIGLPLDFPPMDDNEQEPGVDLVRRAREAGAWISFPHPHWNTATEADAMTMIDLIDAVEVYNHGSEVLLHKGWALLFAETLLQKGYHLQLNATDDAHVLTSNPNYCDAFGGWMMVKAESLEPDALLTAIKAGAYYSSTGPEFHNVRILKDVIQVDCSPVSEVIVNGHRAVSHIRFGEEMTSVAIELPTPEKTPYFRVTIRDARGGFAWTNPIWYTEDYPHASL